MAKARVVQDRAPHVLDRFLRAMHGVSILIPVDELAVNARETLAASRPPQVQGIGEVHAALGAIQRLGDKDGILDRDTRQAAEGPQRRHDVLCGVAIGAAQHPFRLQHERDRQEKGPTVDRRPRAQRLLGVVAGQLADDDAGINGDHGAAGPRQGSRHPSP